MEERGSEARFIVNEESSDRVHQKVLKWFGHVSHLSGERLIKRVYESEE